MKVFKMKFGESGDNVNAFGIRFYGEFDSKVGQDGSFSEIIYDPDTPSFTEHQRITLWFIFAKIRPYEQVSDFIRQLADTLQKKSYATKTSSVDGLVDTRSKDYINKPERNFPASYRMHRCNAATGFSVTAERTDDTLKFTLTEVVSIAETAVRLGRAIYGKNLKMVKVKTAI